MLTSEDISILQQRGIPVSQIESQLVRLQQGVPPIFLVRPCRLTDGVTQLSLENQALYQTPFDTALQSQRVSKFIPASGAATRMFKDLLEFLQKQISTPAVQEAWRHLEAFPFILDLKAALAKNGHSFQQLQQVQNMTTIFQSLLLTPGLGYADLPKALLLFHQYHEGSRTSLEEHVQEAMHYSQNTPKHVNLHLTISPQHEKLINNKLLSIQAAIEKEGKKVDITVSLQKPSTDTIALDSLGQLFRSDNGKILFRPGGHGALLENLNDYQGDIVFISNIDNVVPDYLKGDIVKWRMSLAGYLIELQNKIFHHLHQLESTQPTVIDEAETFVQQHLHHQFPTSYDRLDISDKTARLKQFLDRPIRVCGVVPNTGDPGGGPFWVRHADGSQSLQIVEQSQVDPESESQQQLFASATHFNPVDMVCGVRDYQGKPFNLLNFSDPDTSFISHKSYQGRPLKALEWPGLWNGGMADWITLFVEIPRATFNPVKSFLDWLHPNHQPLPK
jgi:hypothetical protein